MRVATEESRLCHVSRRVAVVSYLRDGSQLTELIENDFNEKFVMYLYIYVSGIHIYISFMYSRHQKFSYLDSHFFKYSS